MSRTRLWTPFFIGWVGGTLALLFEPTIGVFLGVYNPLTGYLAAEIYAGLAVGVIAALVSHTWLGLLKLVLGLLTAGATAGVVFAVSTGDFGYVVFAVIATRPRAGPAAAPGSSDGHRPQ